MSAASSHHDRGMRAVRRVREVRERDSRIGLLHALTAVRDREAKLEELRNALEKAVTREADTLDQFVVSRILLGTMAEAVGEAEHRLAAARTVAAVAHQRWQADKAAMKAVEHLLEQRGLARADEAARAEVREVDDVVGRLHMGRSA
jgi:flagellar biosynthesis chaperone FliJ